MARAVTKKTRQKKSRAERAKELKVLRKECRETMMIHGQPMVAVELTKASTETQKSIRYEFDSGKRAEFMAYLAENHYDELRRAGMTKAEINEMEAGVSPLKYDVHHIQPVECGGGNDFDNLCIVRKSPYHYELHSVAINPQLEGMKEGDKRTIYLPQTGQIFISPERQSESERANAEKISRISLNHRRELKRAQRAAAHTEIKSDSIHRKPVRGRSVSVTKKGKHTAIAQSALRRSGRGR